MKIAVLTGGLSLLDLWCEEFTHEYDRVIAVNGAAFHFESDYVAFIDRIVWEALNEKRAHWPRLGFFTHHNWPVPAGMERRVLPFYQARYGRIPEDVAKRQAVTECSFTFPSALMGAQDMAAGGQVEVFGFDYDWEPNVIGINSHHASLRWALELEWVKAGWGPNVRAFGRAHPTILAYLRGEASLADMERVVLGK